MKRRVAALRVPGGAKISRKEIDDFTKYVGNYGARGLAWIKVNDKAAGVEGLQSPILKFMPEATVSQLVERLALEDGDIVFFGADKRQVVNDALGALRLKVAEMMGLVGEGWAPLWVVDFPMFEETGDGGLTAIHHPFTAPSCDVEALAAAPEKALSRAYDMVLNGSEMAVVLFVFTVKTCKKRSLMCWVSLLRKLTRSLGSCSLHLSTVRHLTVDLRLVSIVSSCSWSTVNLSAM